MLALLTCMVRMPNGKGLRSLLHVHERVMGLRSLDMQGLLGDNTGFAGQAWNRRSAASGFQ